jgi:hypothetical protein
MSQELMIEVVNKLLQDKSSESIKDELPTVICALLKPFCNRTKPSRELDLKMSNMIRSYGVCSKCRNERLKHSSDVFCKYCKSVLKDQAKAKVE